MSVAFWLSFNECVLTVEFLRAAVQLARRTDPTRLISGANCMDVKLTKQLFDEAGCDFYTFHPYGADKDHVSCGVDSDNRWDRPLQSLENVCRVLSGKPVIFTEWGGFFHLDEPRRLQDYCAELFRLADNAPGEPVLAGASYWIWADYYEANRATPASVEGVTIEGLTDMRRNPRIGYQVLREAIARRACPGAAGRRVAGAKGPMGGGKGTVYPLYASAFLQGGYAQTRAGAARGLGAGGFSADSAPKRAAAGDNEGRAAFLPGERGGRRNFVHRPDLVYRRISACRDKRRAGG